MDPARINSKARERNRITQNTSRMNTPYESGMEAHAREEATGIPEMNPYAHLSDDWKNFITTSSYYP